MKALAIPDARRDGGRSAPAPSRVAGSCCAQPQSAASRAIALVPGLGLTVQRSRLAVSSPDDPSEVEADRVADLVMRTPMRADARPQVRELAGEGALHRACAAYAEAADLDLPRTVAGGTSGGGRALDEETRASMESSFGQDFGHVRVHTGAGAAASAQALAARAFTVGRDIVFGDGQYAPHTAPGRRLLAHELVHVAQQSVTAPWVQRSLVVDPAAPTDPEDPLSTMSAPAFESLAFTDMGSIVNSLCDLFTVDGAGNVVAAPTACTDRSTVAGGSHPIGCCCLCALTDPAAGAWTIHVTGIGGPRTEPAATGGGEFFLHPRTSSFQFGTWSTAGTREIADPVVVAGHELCGHGALIERGLHPDESIERVDTNVHDPTVRVENLIKAEQGLTGPDRAPATGPHRGESFARITLSNFAFNSSTIPASEATKLQLAKDFINARNTWVDIFGHSDLVGSPAAKLAVSQARANATRTALTTGLRPVSPTISRTFTGTSATGTGTVTVAGNRITRVEGRSDFDAIPGAAAPDLRRVDIVMPTRPAGAEVPNPGTPTNVDFVGPQSIGTFLLRRFLGNACDRLLAKSAWI